MFIIHTIKITKHTVKTCDIEIICVLTLQACLTPLK